MLDCCGIDYNDHRLWLPVLASDFPRPKVEKNPTAIKLWRERWAFTPCWWCGCHTHTACGHDDKSKGELHHMARYDLPTCFTWLCANCHRIRGKAVTKDSLGKMLWKKHHYDRANLSWVLLALAIGKHLPDLRED